MEDLRDKNTTDKEAYNSNDHQVLPLSPSSINSIGDVIQGAYPEVTFVEKSDDTPVFFDNINDNTIVPTSSSTLIDADTVDAGDTTNISRKRSHAASAELKLSGNLATTSATEPKSSEPVNKKHRKEVSKKPPSKSSTKSNSIFWRRILEDYAKVCDQKVFADFLKEWREKDSNDALLNECLRRPGFLAADETLEWFFKDQGFEDKVSERTLTTDVVERILDKNPEFKDKVSERLMTTDVIGKIFDLMPLKTLSKLIQSGINILAKKVDDASASENK